jgi:hypothetical protein
MVGAAPDGKLSWAVREPIATLTADGKTVGRHYAGPHHEQLLPIHPVCFVTHPSAGQAEGCRMRG